MTSGNRVSDVSDSLALRKAFGAFLTGVTVVTAYDDQGRPRGITVNSFSSVSMSPPLVSFCVDQGAASLSTFVDCSAYAINILGADQQEEALRFARRGADKFVDMSFGHSSGGAPVLHGAIAWFDCTVHQCVDAGDHVIIIGRVRDYAHANGAPLGFFQGAFMSPNVGSEAHVQNVVQASSIRVGWLLEDANGSLALCRQSDGRYAIPVERLSIHDLDYVSLSARASQTMGRKAQIQFLFSMYAAHGGGELVLVYRGVLSDTETETDKINGSVYMVNVHQTDLAVRMDRTDASIVQRYLQERVGDGFGIYSGNEFGGSVARILHPGRSVGL